MPDSQYYFSGNYAQPDCESEEYKQDFKSTVDEVFGKTKKKIFDILHEEETKEKLIEQMKHLNEDENKKEKCPFLKIPVTKTENDETLFSLIDENFRDKVDTRCDFDENDGGKTITLKSDKYIEKKIEELKGYYRSLITTFYLKRVVELENREEVLKLKNDDNENNTKELILESINDRHICYLQLPLELQEQARKSNKSLIIRDDVDIKQGYQQSRGFLQLGLFNKEKYNKEYKENKNNKLLTYFKNYCIEPYYNYNLETMDDLTVLKDLWMVKHEYDNTREIDYGFNPTDPAVNKLNIVHANTENFINSYGGKRKSRRRLNTKSTKKSRKSKKSKKSRKSRKSKKSRKSRK